MVLGTESRAVNNRGKNPALVKLTLDYEIVQSAVGSDASGNGR